MELRQQKGRFDAGDYRFLEVSCRSNCTPANTWLLQAILSFHEPPPLGEDVMLGRRLGVNPSSKLKMFYLFFNKYFNNLIN
jgi:hypothetical protein